MVNSIIGACAVRLSRLDADGTPDFDNATGAFALCGGISTFEHDYEVEEGDEILEKDACGNLCVNVKRDDQAKRVTWTLTLCKTDDRVYEIMDVATLLEEEGEPVGHGVALAAGCEPFSRNAFALELWSEVYDCDVVTGFRRSVVTRAKARPKGYTRENGVSLPVFEGYGISNPNFGDGPFGDLDVVEGLTLGYFEIDDAALPTCPDPLDYIPTPSSLS